jgi:hypothetical protein
MSNQQPRPNGGGVERRWQGVIRLLCPGVPLNVRFSPECVAKLFAALQLRNNRI